MKQLVIAMGAAIGVAAFAATLRGDSSPAPSEPATDATASGEAGASPLPSPFDPPDTGGPGQEVPYEALSPADQAVMDRGRNVGGAASTRDAFRAASIQTAREHAAEIAARTLGLGAPEAEQ